MKTIIALLALFITAIFIGCVARRSEPIKQKYFTVTDQDVLNGEKLFMEYCHKCHPNGESGLGPSINANPAPQFLKRFQVRHGLGVMPAFKPRRISRADLHDISKYMKAYKHY